MMLSHKRNDKDGSKTTPYFRFFRKQKLFLLILCVFRSRKVTVMGDNLSIEAKVCFVDPQNVLGVIDVSHYPSRMFKAEFS